MSRIVAARLVRLVVPFRVPLRTADRSWTERRLGLVVLIDADGRQGLGELAADDAWDQPIWVTAERDLGALLGREVVDAVDATSGTRAVAAAISTAGLDLLARTTGRSLAAELDARLDGPSGEELRILGAARVNALIGGEGADEQVRAALAAVGRGSTCLKLKAIRGGSIGALVESIGAVRQAVGSSVQLRLDANGAWTEDQAIAYLGALADPQLHLEYVEQPVRPELGLAVLGRVRRAAQVPIAADESVLDLAAAERLLAADAVDVLVVKPARVGGPLEAVRIARLAQAHGVPTVLSTLFETGVGLAAALHVAALLPGDGPAHGLDTAALLADDLVLGDLRPVEGRLALPPGPGLGVAIDDAATERYRVG